MKRNARFPVSLCQLCVWMFLGNCYFNPVVQLVVNPEVKEEGSAVSASLLAALGLAPSPYFSLVSSIPADGEDITPPLTTYTFTFSEAIENNVSDPMTWISENIILTETINIFPVVTISDRKMELSVDPALDNLLTYTIAFGEGIKAKTGKTLSPNTKITFTCSGCMPL